MKGLRGFRIGGRVKRAFKWIVRTRRKPNLLAHPTKSRCLNPISRLIGFLRRGASDPGCIRLVQDGPKPVELEVPKGHLAVYVGESESDRRRVAVPVIYLNHPLFRELLKEAERVYGYDHLGGITIPCGYSEFEKVKARIAKWDACKRRCSNATISNQN